MQYLLRIWMVTIGLLSLSIGGEAQSTYAFIYLKNEGKFNMVKGDFLSQEYDVLFSLDTSRFYEHDAYRYTPNNPGISAFEFSADSSKIYFLEELGDFYVYDILSDDMAYIKDLSEQPSSSSEPYFIYDGYNYTFDLKLLNDSTLYVAGSVYGKLNLNTYDFELIRNVESLSVGLTDYEQNLLWHNSVINNSDTFYLNIRGKLLDPDLDFPDSNKVICDFGLFFPENQNQIYRGFIFYHEFDCDSSGWYIFDKFSEQNFNLYKIDISNCSIEEIYNSLEFDGYLNDSIHIAHMKHYNNVTHECELYIDLDQDDSTVEGIDYDGKEVCMHTGLPISDDDVELRNTYPFDSIRVEIDNEQADQYISIESGNYAISNNNTPDVIILNNGSTQLSDYQQALQTARYIDDASYRPGSVQIKVTGWYNGDSTETAVANYVIIPRPDAGPDMDLEYCPSDGSILLRDELEVKDEGDFYSMTGDATSGSVLLNDPMDTSFIYIVENGLCADTSVWNITVHPDPEIVNIQDQRLCPGNSFTADLTALTGTIEWFDGGDSRIREFENEGIYFYEHTSSEGCPSADSFEIEFLNQAIRETVDTTLCHGETFTYRGITYNSTTIIRDSLQSVAGCDSVILTLNINFQSQRNLIEQDTIGSCAGKNVEVPLNSDLTVQTLNGNPVTSPLMIENAGNYTLKATDEYGCTYTDTFQLVHWPSPGVTTQDIIDGLYQQDMQLPVSYSGTISLYRWTPNAGLSCYDCPYPELQSPEQGSYSIIVENEFGCRDTASIDLKFSIPDIYVPNIISANSGIEENEVFYVRSESEMIYNLQIFSRWGDLIYENPYAVSNDISSGWRPARRDLQGVFVYKIAYRSNDGQIRYLVGSVTVY